MSLNSDKRNQADLLVSIICVGIFFIALFDIAALVRADFSTAIVLSSVLLALSISYYHVRFKAALVIGQAMLVPFIALLFLYHLISGGVEQTGLLWNLAIIPMFVFLLGFKGGFILLVGGFALCCFLLFWPDPQLLIAEYSHTSKTRWLAAYIVASLLCLIQQRSREKAYAQLHRVNVHHKRAATTDELTGLANRRAMTQHARNIDKTTLMENECGYALILTDIDYFKKINDNYGHDTGDYVLRAVARALDHAIADQHFLARWGGEEFLILLPNIQQQQAIKLAEQLRSRIAELQIPCEQGMITVTMSFGVADNNVTQKNGQVSFQNVLQYADNALYQAKDDGRNCVKAPQMAAC